MRDGDTNAPVEGVQVGGLHLPKCCPTFVRRHMSIWKHSAVRQQPNTECRLVYNKYVELLELYETTRLVQC